MTSALRPEMVRVPPQPATPANLPETIRSLWQTPCEDGGNVSRALTINFVAVAKATDEEELRATTDRLIQSSPARAFLLLVDDTLTEPCAEVSAITRNQRSTRDVVLEMIFVRFPLSWLSHVPGLVRPLLINDLPNHLYWADDWSDDPDFAALRDLSDHWAVDSSRFSLPAVQLAKVDEQRSHKTRTTDLTWLRLQPWRRALAEAFQRVSWPPGTATDIVIRHGKNAAAAAILLAQWLESKLGARIELEDSAAAQAVCPESATLRFCDCEIAATSDGKLLTVHVTTDAHCLLPFRLPCSSGDNGDLLAAAIDIA